jgi:dihydrofolate reductase
MRTVTSFVNLTLDGVYQAPGRPDEDPRGDFAFGGWAAPYQAMAEAGEVFGSPVELLFGRWTYELFHASWGPLTDNPFSQFFRATPKHVVTRQAAYRPAWENTTAAIGEAGDVVRRLKQTAGAPLLVFGSGELVTALTQEGLVDRYILLIHPVLLGSGHRYAVGLTAPRNLALVSTKTTSQGVVMATYEKKES